MNPTMYLPSFNRILFFLAVHYPRNSSTVFLRSLYFLVGLCAALLHILLNSVPLIELSLQRDTAEAYPFADSPILDAVHNCGLRLLKETAGPSRSPTAPRDSHPLSMSVLTTARGSNHSIADLKWLLAALHSFTKTSLLKIALMVNRCNRRRSHADAGDA